MAARLPVGLRRRQGVRRGIAENLVRRRLSNAARLGRRLMEPVGVKGGRRRIAIRRSGNVFGRSAEGPMRQSPGRGCRGLWNRCCEMRDQPAGMRRRGGPVHRDQRMGGQPMAAPVGRTPSPDPSGQHGAPGIVRDRRRRRFGRAPRRWAPYDIRLLAARRDLACSPGSLRLWWGRGHVCRAGDVRYMGRV